jgi:hypothetical protein
LASWRFDAATQISRSSAKGKDPLRLRLRLGGLA